MSSSTDVAPAPQADRAPEPMAPPAGPGAPPRGESDGADVEVERRDGRAAPRRSRRYGVLLAVPLAVGFVLRLWFALGDEVITNDATTYLESGRNLIEGRGFVRADGLPELHFPPGAPLVLGAAWKLTGSAWAALVSVTLLTSFLCLLPLAALARRLGGDRAGIAACGVGALAAGLTSVPTSSAGGSEMLSLLFLLTCLWLVSTLPSRQGAGMWTTAGLAGLAGGALYLTRPEGLLLVLVIVTVMTLTSGVVGDLRRRELSRGRLTRQLGPPAVLFVLVAVCMAPYAAYLHGQTGAWAVTAKSQDANLEAWRAVADGDRRGRDRVLYELDDSGLGFVERSESLTTLARDDPEGYAGIVDANAAQLWSEYAAPAEGVAPPSVRWALLPLPLTLLAIWAGWRGRRDPTVVTLVGIVTLATATCLGFFVQSRYLIPAVGVLCVLAGVGLARLRPSWRTAGLIGAIGLLALPLLFDASRSEGPFATREPVEHQVAGEWLAAHSPVDSRIMTRSLVTEFYAARTAVPPPFGTLAEALRFARHHGVDYLVVDELQTHRFRPQLTSLLEPGPWPGLRLVHGLRQDGRLTRIFALDPAPSGNTANPPGLGFAGDG